MLEKLLEAIRSGGTFENGALATRLGTSPEMVEAMLEHLQRIGYLQPYQACHESCGGCSLKSACQSTAQADSVRLWQA